MANLQLAKNLLYLRTKCQLTQDDIADIFSISRQTCSNYETGARTPGLDVLASFACFYHVTFDQLILHDLESEGFEPRLTHSSVMRESMSPYLRGIEKNTGNYIYISQEELDLIFDFRSSTPERRKLITGFLHSDN